MIPISKPYLPSLKNAHLALDSRWVSSVNFENSFIERSTKLLEEITGCKVLLVNNGTAATHLTVRCLQKFYGGDVIITSNNSYVAAWNSILFDKYYFFHPVEADILTWNFDLELLQEAIKKFSTAKFAVQYIHNIGNIIPIEKSPYPIIEDNCEGFHSGYAKSKHSLCASISFFGNKLYTSGEGGAFLTDNPDVLDYAKHVAQQGQTNEKFIHDELAYNYRMTNIQAAILFDSLLQMETIEQERDRVWNTYLDNLFGVNIKVQKIPFKHSHWYFGVRIPDNKSYKKVEDFFLSKGIETRPLFYPMSYHTHLKPYAKENQEHIARTLNKECVLLPTFPDLTDSEIKYICQSLKEYLNE